VQAEQAPAVEFDDDKPIKPKKLEVKADKNSTVVLVPPSEMPGGEAPNPPGKWDETPNTHCFGGKRWPAAKTKNNCKKLCKRSQRCKAVDWDESKKTCYAYHKDMDTKERGPSPGVTHCELDRSERDDDSSSSTTEAAAPTTTEASSMTTAGSQCVLTGVQVQSNWHSWGGINIDIINDVDTCLFYCFDLLGVDICFGVDWNALAYFPFNPCYIFTDRSRLDVIGNLTGINQYTPESSCSGAPPDQEGGDSSTASPSGSNAPVEPAAPTTTEGFDR
jgi:hypothetical protein